VQGLRELGWLLYKDERLDAAEETASHCAIELLAEKDEEYLYV